MGLTKQYLAYRPLGSFNLIASGRPNVSFIIYNAIEGRYIVTGAAEKIILWDLKLSKNIAEFTRENQEVTAIRPSPDRIHIAVGYADGIVEIFNIETKSVVVSLALHKSAVTILRYDTVGIRLLSGGMDTELVISDIVSQMGKSRLIGHNAPITDGYFMETFDLDNIIVSSSKDTQIKFWSLETQNCFKTLVDNRTEVWGLAIVSNFLIAGCGESTMNVYRIMKNDFLNKNRGISNLVEGLSLDDEDFTSPINVVNCGTIQRAGKGRTVSLTADNSKRIISCHGTNDLIESFYFCTESEAKLRLTKRLKKLSQDSDDVKSQQLSLSDEIRRLQTIKVGTKIKSIDNLIGLHDELRILVNCANNSLRMYSIQLKKKNIEPELIRSITQSGHQSEVRPICFSSDTLAIASGSGESLKLWNRDSMQCLRTIQTEYILTICFVPGDRHVLLGMKSGNLLIVDISSGDIIETIQAHKNELWSICLLPDLKGCVTGSSDKTVKIWSFELIENNSTNPFNEMKLKVLSLLHKSTLQLEETVLCLKVSGNSKFLAVGLLDSTVKIFFLDSFKFYLSLYGHKLPILCMDISYDSSLIVTGSADRNIKIWGMDFGDCHRSLFGHNDSVMSIQFIPKTHMFFSCGKDGKIKQWDGDTFDKIITLPGHIGEAYSLSISSNGKYLITSGSDRTLRLFERTDEPIILKDVQEEEREEFENKTLATGDDNTIPTLPGLKLPSRKTVGSEKAVESIIECLEISKFFDNEENPEIHPLMLAHNVKTSDELLIDVLQRIRASDLEEALVLLPFSNVCEILERIPKISENRKDQTELICKIVLFLFKIHHKPIVNNQILLPIIGKIINKLNELISELKDLIGVNYYAFQLFQRDIEEREGIELFKDATRLKKQRDKKQKRKQLAKRVYVQMK